MYAQLRIFLKRLALGAAALSCIHCGANPALADAPDGAVLDSLAQSGKGALASTIVLGKVGALRKGAVISLKKLYITAISGSTPPDTVLDSVEVGGNEAATVTRTLTLKPLRQWMVSARTVDQRDSVIHSGTAAPVFVKPADTASVTLDLVSRFSMYQADFNSLPDSITSATPSTGKDKLNLNRVVLEIDGVIKADSALASGYFAAGQGVDIAFDYIAPGTHTVTLEAYGALHAYTGMLYSGSATFSVAAGVDDTRAVTLNWVGPATGTGKLTVNLGKVGRVTVNGGIPGAIL